MRLLLLSVVALLALPACDSRPELDDGQSAFEGIWEPVAPRSTRQSEYVIIGEEYVDAVFVDEDQDCSDLRRWRIESFDGGTYTLSWVQEGPPIGLRVELSLALDGDELRVLNNRESGVTIHDWYRPSDVTRFGPRC